jgi:RNA-directed DNA polymerase
MEQFGLALHPEKTRLIEFGRFADQNRRKREGRKPETFDFLGFTHLCARKHWSGGFIVRRQSSKKRLRAKLAAVKQALMRRRHLPILQQGVYLRSVVQGFLNYHAVPGNSPALGTFCRECARHWLKALKRRSQRHRMSWARFRPWVDRLIPKPAILHPYPNERFYAKHPK